jgi:glycosyltransferase involved in cell wall biosynthesis
MMNYHSIAPLNGPSCGIFYLCHVLCKVQMMNPKVSIILPNFNHLRFLRERVESILNQSFQDFELIILDDKSSDGSQAFLSEYQQHPKVSHIILNEANSGSTFKQWNKGLQLAQGQLIWIAESDDRSDPEFLARLVSQFDAHPGKLSFAYCQSLNIDEFGQVTGSRLDYTSEFTPNIWTDDFVLAGHEFIQNFLKVKNLVPNASAVLFDKARVASLQDVTYMKMKKCGDWLFWLKLAELGSIAFVSDTLNHFREHNSVTRIHGSVDQAYIRCVEEKMVRDILANMQFIEQENEVKTLYRRWFVWQDWPAIFTIRFYSVCTSNTAYLAYVLFFLSEIDFYQRIKTKFLKKLGFYQMNKFDK